MFGPQASTLFDKINRLSTDEDSENLATQIRNAYRHIDDETKARIGKLPTRVKTAKIADTDSGVNGDNVLVLQKKGLGLFALAQSYADNNDNGIVNMELADFIEQIKCEKDTERKAISKSFWDYYQPMLDFQDSPSTSNSGGGQSIESKARNRLKSLRKEHKRNEVVLVEETLYFVRILLQDISDYKTLSINNLRELGEENSDKLVENIVKLRRLLGDDYLNLAIE